ncbi:MAG: hypothetical protein ACFE7R_08960 [Candidatus Hodarchaeota archaeon]
MSDEEKIIAQGMLMAALEKKFNRLWTWGLNEIKTEESYQFLLNLYNKERELLQRES